ncbi:MAG: hypothetical protein M1826_007166 [Phylliscum demangeonii]|nr:MAG: hypothetical protein M1826_007166 [Phylliscum demangeonii]
MARGRGAPATDSTAGRGGPSTATPTTTSGPSAGTGADAPPPPPSEGSSGGKFSDLPAEPVAHFCLRCAKQLGKEPGLVCRRRADLKQCERCARLGGKCARVPVKYQPRLVQLQFSAAAVVRCAPAGRHQAAAQAVLATHSRDFTARVEAHARRAGRKARPEAEAAFSAGQRETHRLLGDLVRVARRWEAAWRQRNNLPLLDEDEDEDDDDDAGEICRGCGRAREEPKEEVEEQEEEEEEA